MGVPQGLFLVSFLPVAIASTKGMPRPTNTYGAVVIGAVNGAGLAWRRGSKGCCGKGGHHG